ncbi:type IX secretion/gliding motility protein PorT/SprT [Flavobacterium sp. C4GT6]|uniref:type IX secretion/gliding motility protein PorT/SprT n=1 Tax=Flavobacterium sp. C4GT6 TaxID=3103818 RepID=UPI002ED0A3B9
MKRYLIYLILICGMQGHAQLKIFGKDPIIHLENFDKQRVHWGYFLGFNSYGFKMDYIDDPVTDIVVKQTTGFNVGLVGNLRIMEHLDLRFEPGLYYTQRDLTYPDIERQSDALRQAKSTYIHFPLLLKFSAKRTGNIKPYLVGGFSRTLNLSSNASSLDDNYSGTFRMKKWTTNYEIGFGIDLYLEYFKFSPSIRGVFGLNDELIRDNNPNSQWTGNINSMKTRAILINFTFH